MMKKTLLTVFLLTIFQINPFLWAADETFVMQAGIPAAVGNFYSLKLPRTLLYTGCQTDTIIRSDTPDHALYHCVVPGTWKLLDDVWTQNANNTVVSPSDAMNLQDLGVAIGTNQKEFKLTLDQDAGIMAKGTYGPTNITLTNLSTTGDGARLIWYPKKSAFRAGSITTAVGLSTGNEWDNSKIGIYSFAAGNSNEASGVASTVAGGQYNRANSNSTAVDIDHNLIPGGNEVILGGWHNTAIGRFSLVGGGAYNDNLGVVSNINGGALNSIGNMIQYGTISGGFHNQIMVNGSLDPRYSEVIGGGINNASNHWWTTIVGGNGNTASEVFATIGGGFQNQATVTNDFVGGGLSNTAAGGTSIVYGGSANTAQGNLSTVIGGTGNWVGTLQSIGGGTNVTIAGNYGIGLGKDISIGSANLIAFGHAPSQIQMFYNNSFVVLSDHVAIGHSDPSSFPSSLSAKLTVWGDPATADNVPVAEFNNIVRLQPRGTPPITCDEDARGKVYVDSNQADLAFCNGAGKWQGLTTGKTW